MLNPEIRAAVMLAVQEKPIEAVVNNVPLLAAALGITQDEVVMLRRAVKVLMPYVKAFAASSEAEGE